MPGIYTYQNLKDEVWDPIPFANISQDVTVLKVLNRAVRYVVKTLDLRTMKRKAATAPTLFNDVYDYNAPTDLKDNAVIDLQPQVNRSREFELNLTTPEEFDRRKSYEQNLMAVKDNDFLKKLRVGIRLNSPSLVLSSLDTLTAGGGTWSAVGDATNLIADTDIFVKGSGSIRWDIGSGGTTTAGIQNTGLNSTDITNYVNLNRSAFVWVYINSAANITNFILRIGSGASAYYQMTVTTTNEGTAFVAGWNLLRFDFSGATTSGSPDKTAITFAAIFMTKTVGKVSETGYRFDHILLEGGSIHDLYYYTKYGWQTSGGTYIENSTTTTDVLVADTDEFDLFVLSGKIESAKERKDFDWLPIYQADLKDAIAIYKRKNPSERKLITTLRYDTNENTNIISNPPLTQ